MAKKNNRRRRRRAKATRPPRSSRRWTWARANASVYVPTNVADVESDEITYEALESCRDSLFRGDGFWPASVALARLLAHCPSLVANKRVLEIGAGLGLAGNAAAKAGAASVLMVDRDADMLALAKRSAVENAPHDPGMCRVETLDWSAVPNEWCAERDQKFDVIVAADVLYDEESARRVAEVVARAMRVGTNRRRREGEGDEDEDRIGGDADDDARAPAMALVADLAAGRRRNRRRRREALGLETVEAGSRGTVRLLQCTRWSSASRSDETAGHAFSHFYVLAPGWTPFSS